MSGKGQEIITIAIEIGRDPFWFSHKDQAGPDGIGIRTAAFLLFTFSFWTSNFWIHKEARTLLDSIQSL